MLDLNVTGLNSEKQTRTTQVRHGASLAALIERATAALGVEKSVFLRNAIAKEAQRAIETSSRHVLTAGDAKLFISERAGRVTLPRSRRRLPVTGHGQNPMRRMPGIWPFLSSHPLRLFGLPV